MFHSILSTRANQFVLLVCLLYLFTYTVFCLSPSSYGIAADQLELPWSGVIWGKPRDVRSDEWAGITPLIQVTVNNGFKRFNETSPYGEDLRMVYSLPVGDWGMFFKPDYWLFLLTAPKYAYSFHHGFFIVLFILGYYLLFSSLGFEPATGLLLSSGLYFTAYVQYWWTVAGCTLAYFPWLVVVFRSSLWLGWRFGLLFYLSACCLLAYFYPPLHIQLFFVFLICIFSSETLVQDKKRWLTLLAVPFGAGVAIYYLADHLRTLSEFQYPGALAAGGGGVASYRVWSHFFPLSTTINHASTTFENVCEDSVVGTFLPLICVFFVRPGEVIRERRFWILLGLSMLVLAWMVLPIPSWLGQFLLWHKVRPQRMVFLFGVCVFALALVFFKRGQVVLSARRLLLFLFFYSGGVISLQSWSSLSFRQHGVLPILVIFAWLFGRVYFSESYRKRALLIATLLPTALYFFSFNPIQSSKVIFDRETYRSPVVTQALAQAGDRIWARPGSANAVMNGVGLRSVSHLLPGHPAGFWKDRAKSLSVHEVEKIFGRWKTLRVTNESQAYAPDSSVVHVPASWFDPAVRDVNYKVSFHPLTWRKRADNKVQLECLGSKLRVYPLDRNWILAHRFQQFMLSGPMDFKPETSVVYFEPVNSSLLLENSDINYSFAKFIWDIEVVGGESVCRSRIKKVCVVGSSGIGESIALTEGCTDHE